MSDYQALLDELRDLAAEPLTKSTRPDADDVQDDADIKAAADGDADDDGEPDNDDALDDYDVDDEPDGDASFGKSFQVTLADGRVIEAFDGQSAIGAMQEEIGALRDETRQALGQIAEALQQSTQLIKSLRSDNAELKTRMSAIGASGRGRKSLLTMHDKPSGGDPAPAAEARDHPRRLRCWDSQAPNSSRMPTWPSRHRDADLPRTAAAIPNTPSSTKSSSSTWRPTSRWPVKMTGTDNAYRPTWSGNFAGIWNAASWPAVLLGRGVRTAGMTS